MRLSRNLQKLASAGPKASSSRGALAVPSRHASTSSVVAAEDRTSTQFHHENLLRTVDVHVSPPSIPLKEASSSNQRPVPSATSFFDPSHPQSSRVRPTPVLKPSAREADTVKLLKELLESPDVVRDEVFAAKVWQHYNTLSPAYRRSLDIKFLSNIFRFVLPNSKYIRQLSQTPKENVKELPKHLVLKIRSSRNGEMGSKWEKRLRTVAADMMASSSVNTSPQLFIKALDKLAAVGEKTGCEAIIKEIRHRYNHQLTYQQMRVMYTHALKSVSRWLRNHAHRHRTAQKEIMQAVEAARRLILAMQEKDISPNPTTAENLLNISRLVSSTIIDASTIESFDSLSEVILTKGYSLDIANLAFNAQSANLKPSVKLAVIDLLGRRGELYKMLAAFDSLFPGDVDRLPRGINEEIAAEEEEVVPTLSAMLAAEQAERAQMGWFGRRAREEHEEVLSAVDAAETSDTPSSRRFNDFLPPIPTPFDILKPDSLVAESSLPAEILQRLQTPSLNHNAAPIEGEGAAVSSVLAMLSRAWLSKIHVSPNDTRYKDVSLHVLRIALRAAHIEQAKWFHSLSPTSTSASSSASNSIASPEGEVTSKLERPGLRAEANWFLAVWRTVRWTRSSDRRGVVAGRIVMAELANAMERIEQERDLVSRLVLHAEAQEQAAVQVSQQDQVETSAVNAVEQGAEASKALDTSTAPSTMTPAPASILTSTPITTPLMNLQAHLEELEELSLALTEIQETIRSNLDVAIAKKARHNAARVNKLAERKREFEELVATKGKKRALKEVGGAVPNAGKSGRSGVLESRSVGKDESRLAGWEAQGEGQAALA